MKIIDSHIHLDKYEHKEIQSILKESDFIEALLTVSTNLESSKRNLQLAEKYQKVKPAFGYHPEQKLPSDYELNILIQWMIQHRSEMIAVGEVGLPFYLRKDNKVTKFHYEQYIDLLETFVEMAKKWEKPIILHAVYDDAPIVCDLLEKHSVSKAHFHWFKGDEKTVERMIQNGYYISVTPELVYKEKIQKLIKIYPLELIMVETDGPWPFEGPFLGKMTQPDMMKSTITMIAKIKDLTKSEVSERILENTKTLYEI